MPNLVKNVIVAKSIGIDAPSVDIAPLTTDTPVIESASCTCNVKVM